jgi:hypothetical protein
MIISSSSKTLTDFQNPICPPNLTSMSFSELSENCWVLKRAWKQKKPQFPGA